MVPVHANTELLQSKVVIVTNAMESRAWLGDGKRVIYKYHENLTDLGPWALLIG